MVQKVFGLALGQVVSFYLPDPETPLMPGIAWGRHDEYFTPAYWAAQARLNPISNHRLGRTLAEEAAACVLGGYGIPAEVGIAAFLQLREGGFLARSVSETDLATALRAPLALGGRKVRYRFVQQKASYLAPLLFALSRREPDTGNHHQFRQWFLKFRGIGLKTASWITRNWLDSQEVAILDIHIYRAGLICGLFSPTNSIQRDYVSMEKQFLSFADRLGVAPGRLDAVIWSQMKEAGRGVYALLPLTPATA
jgi:N-glycosylase/DNA lyase